MNEGGCCTVCDSCPTLYCVALASQASTQKEMALATVANKFLQRWTNLLPPNSCYPPPPTPSERTLGGAGNNTTYHFRGMRYGTGDPMTFIFEGRSGAGSDVQPPSYGPRGMGRSVPSASGSRPAGLREQ